MCVLPPASTSWIISRRRHLIRSASWVTLLSCIALKALTIHLPVSEAALSILQIIFLVVSLALTYPPRCGPVYPGLWWSRSWLLSNILYSYHWGGWDTWHGILDRVPLWRSIAPGVARHQQFRWAGRSSGAGYLAGKSSGSPTFVCLRRQMWSSLMNESARSPRAWSCVFCILAFSPSGLVKGRLDYRW